MSITVVCPSRGRPKAALDTMRTFLDTVVRVDTSFVLAVDEDDPELDAYRDTRNHIGVIPSDNTFVMILSKSETGDLVRATNAATARLMASAEPGDIIGNIGDDHRFRTIGWDKRIMNALSRPGIAYGDDLFQRENLPTAPFISVEIIRALGHYAEPALRHMYIDNVWRDIGQGIGSLVYLPEVVIEHVHPQAPNRKNAVKWDDQYLSYNNDEFKYLEERTYRAWRQYDMDLDIERVKHALR